MNPHDHDHRHLHPPLFVMCPCRCRHHRHYHSYHLHQHPSHRLVAPPPISTTNMAPPVFVPPTGGSSYPVQYQASDPVEVSEARAAGFPSERSQEHEWSEEQLEEDEEAIFVLTDEWAEFFARSEAKRKLVKQQKRKGAK